MFSETEFQTDDANVSGSQDFDKESNVDIEANDLLFNRKGKDGNNMYDVHFHRPGDLEYSVVARATRTETKRKENVILNNDEEINHFFANSNSQACFADKEQIINGDAWLSSECHCLRCESIRVIASLDKIEKENRTKYYSDTSTSRKNITKTDRNNESYGHRDDAKNCRNSNNNNSIEQINKSRCHEQEVIVLVLLDLDNYGFNHFKAYMPHINMKRKRANNTQYETEKINIPSNMNDNDNDNDSKKNYKFVLDHLFVWAFYSSCFARYHKVFPTVENLCKSLSESECNCNKSHNNNNNNNNTIVNAISSRQSIWEVLCSANRVHLTPCGGQSQAVDDVIVEVATLFRQRQPHILVITGDVKLIKLIRHVLLKENALEHASNAREKKKIVCTNNTTENGTVECINVHDYNRNAIRVWRAIAKTVLCAIRKQE